MKNITGVHSARLKIITKKMWRVLCVLCVLFINFCKADMSPSYYCADINPQPHVDIKQLTGMWYGVEIISHKQDEEHIIRTVASCPVIHIVEDAIPTTTVSPLHKDYNYGYNYGGGYDGNYRGSYSYETTTRRQETYGYQGNHRRYYNTSYKRRHWENVRRLHLNWDESGNEVVYHLRYNISKPGFWKSSGPENGFSLEPQFRYFAGTLQVIKAVGSHLVITFCHQLPERQLFTILLSRETSLELSEINGVHNLLHRKGLPTNNIKKVCTGGSASNAACNFILLTAILFWTLCRYFRLN